MMSTFVVIIVFNQFGIVYIVLYVPVIDNKLLLFVRSFINLYQVTITPPSNTGIANDHFEIVDVSGQTGFSKTAITRTIEVVFGF